MTSKEAFSDLLTYEITTSPIFLTEAAEQAWMAEDPGYHALEDAWSMLHREGAKDIDDALARKLDSTNCPFTADALRERGVADLVYRLAGKDAAMQVARYLAQNHSGLDQLAAILGRGDITRQGQ